MFNWDRKHVHCSIRPEHKATQKKAKQQSTRPGHHYASYAASAEGRKLPWQCSMERPVSYTHLTLPTICSV
eukprot:808822-Prorocentrum_lima.AAC.1